MPASRSRARPLVVSSDEVLLDDLLRLLAAAGAEAQVATGGPALRRAHRDAPLVLLGADALTVGPVRSLPRRPGVVVVAARELPADRWAAAVEVGAERVAVLPQDEPWLLARVVGAVRAPVDRGRLVLVGGCCGGAGASTLAVAVALVAAPEGPPGVVLVDTDAWGGGLDLLLGAERVDGLRWPDLVGLRGRVAGDAVLAALPDTEGVHVVAADRTRPVEPPDEALAAVVEAALAHGCTVVVDGGRATALPADLGAATDLAVLLVPARLRAATAARMLVEADDSPWSHAHVVVRPVPGGLGTADVAAVVDRPVLAELRHDRAAVPRGERGEAPAVAPRSPLGTVARRVLAAVVVPETVR